MKILSIETTERIGSLAALSDDKTLSTLTLNDEQRSAQSLTVGLRDLLTEVGWETSDVDLVAVTQGPGSFTGLRVGLTAAKVFAYCAEAEIMGVNTLDAIAARCPADVSRVAVAVDAQRDQVVGRLYKRDEQGAMRPDGEERLVDWDVFLAELPVDVPLSGPILQRKAKHLADDPAIRLLDPAYWGPTAQTVGELAYEQYAAGRRDDVWTILPRYSRQSAAEEKWAERQEEREKSSD